MDEAYCPICSGKLETRDVAPCVDCGHLPREIDEAMSGIHTFDLVRVFGRFTIVLCDFCQADFYSYSPTYFGIARDRDFDAMVDMEFIHKVVEIEIIKDKFCPKCKHRLAFLSFLHECQELFKAGSQ